jgi:hypothetical protein
VPAGDSVERGEALRRQREGRRGHVLVEVRDRRVVLHAHDLGERSRLLDLARRPVAEADVANEPLALELDEDDACAFVRAAILEIAKNVSADSRSLSAS